MKQLLLINGFWDNLGIWIEKADTWLFLQINTNWTNSWLDNILPWWRDANTWIPMYLFLILFLALNFKNQAWKWIFFAIATVILTDQFSSHFVKNFIQRPRPCADDYLQFHVRLLLDHCSGGYSFTSSHAANHFGFAAFVWFTMKSVLKRWKWLFIFWAATISYGQVYVGVHYPLDVIFGALIGVLAGSLTGTIFVKQFGELQFIPQTENA